MFPRVPGAPAADGSALGALLAPEEYQAQRQNVFPSEQSLRWFIRRNRALSRAASAAMIRAFRAIQRDAAMNPIPCPDPDRAAIITVDGEEFITLADAHRGPHVFAETVRRVGGEVALQTWNAAHGGYLRAKLSISASKEA